MTRESTLTDAALPQAPRLLDGDAMAPVLERLLGREPVTSVRIRYLRYKPATRLIVRYEVAAGETTHDVVAFAEPASDLAARAAAPETQALARRLGDRLAARTPVAFDPELDALIQWPPLDIALPAIAEPPEELGARLAAAGVPPQSDDDLPRLVKYRPLTNAVLRLERHVAKTFADRRAYARCVRGLAAAAQLPVRTARCEAVLPELGLAVQSLVAGMRPVGHDEVAARAGGMLARLHATPLDVLTTEQPSDRLEAARGDADLLGAILPRLRPRLEQLLARLEVAAPDDELVTSHGGFHLSQLLDDEGDLAVIDFDGICLAPRARDLGSFLVSIVETPDDLPRVEATYSALADAYGSRPPGVAWYMTTLLLRRARRPFTRLRERWPERVETGVAAAEAALELEL